MRNATITIDGITVELPGTREELEAMEDPVAYWVREYDDDRSGRIFRTEVFEKGSEAANRCLNLRHQGHEADALAVYQDENGVRTERMPV